MPNYHVCMIWLIGTAVGKLIFILLQWTPLIRLTLGPAHSESYNRMNLIGEVGKKM